MRCGSSLRVMTSTVVFAASLNTYRHLSVWSSSTVTMQCGGSDIRTVLLRLQQKPGKKQRGKRQGFSSKDGTVLAEREETDGVQHQEMPSLRQIIQCSEAMCQSENVLERPKKEEWLDAVLLLLRAMARAKRIIPDKEIQVQENAVHLVPWCTALRLFLHSPPSQDEETGSEHKLCVRQIASCEYLLRCCLRHGAPVDVSRGVYLTLRASGQAPGVKISSGWHASYARFLLYSDTTAPIKESAASVASSAKHEHALELQKEALRVLLLDAAEDGEELQPTAVLTALEILHHMSTCEQVLSSSVEQLPQGTTAQEALWLCLLREKNAVTVSRDLCCCVLRTRGVSVAMMQEAFCFLFAVGMRLSKAVLQPFICRRLTTTTVAAPCALHVAVTPQRYVFLLDLVSELLSAGSKYREAIARVLAEPYMSQHSSHGGATFVSVWLVHHIVAGLSVFRDQAASFRNVDGDDVGSDELGAWRQCTCTAVHCLQRILLHISGYRRHPSTQRKRRQEQQARQEVFCLLFHGVLDGLFCASITSEECSGTARKKNSGVMEVLVQFYTENDWHSPSVGLFVECLHAWGMYDVLRRVFFSVYQRDRHVGPWFLSLSTCQLVVQSACEHNDPRTAAFTIAYMLRCLLAIKSSTRPVDDEDSEEEEEEGDKTGTKTGIQSASISDCVMDGKNLVAWTHLIQEQLIPQVDEVFCRTGTDSAQQWLNDLGSIDATVSVCDDAVGDIQRKRKKCSF